MPPPKKKQSKKQNKTKTKKPKKLPKQNNLIFIYYYIFASLTGMFSGILSIKHTSSLYACMQLSYMLQTNTYVKHMAQLI